MKKPYMIPDFEVERYELNTAIAANCSTIISNGPEMDGHEVCEGYEDMFETPVFRARTLSTDAPFYDEGTCYCYYSSGGDGFWTS